MNLIKQLIKHEGMRLKPYVDTVGKTTIGVGRNIDDNGISEAEAMMMLEHDIADCESEAMRTWTWFPLLGEVRQNVLLNMVFNMGMPRVLGFRNMLHAIELQDYTKASADMLDSKWARQVGGRARELAAQMKSGEA